MDVLNSRGDLYSLVAWLRMAPKTQVDPEHTRNIKDLLGTPPTLILDRLEELHTDCIEDDGVSILFTRTVEDVIKQTKHFIGHDPEEARLQELLDFEEQNPL